jgi:hypothetical protein
MAKRKTKTTPFRPKKAQGVGGNGEQSVEKLERIEALDLRCKLLNKNNADLQKQLFEAKSTIVQLEAKLKLMEFEKAATTIVDEYQEGIRVVSEKYDLDLKVDKIDLMTGIITRVDNEVQGRTETEEG